MLNYYCVVAEPSNVSFIPSVEEDWAANLMPVLVVKKISLLEGAVLKKSKVINL